MTPETSTTETIREAPARPGTLQAYRALVEDAMKPIGRENARLNEQFIRALRGMIVSTLTFLLSFGNAVIAIALTASILAIMPLLYLLIAVMYPVYRWRIWRIKAAAQARELAERQNVRR